MQRQTFPISLSISIPNTVQQRSPGTLSVDMGIIERVVGPDGTQVGQAGHFTRSVIPADLTPEVLAALNAQLAYLGVALAPIPDSVEA